MPNYRIVEYGKAVEAIAFTDWASLSTTVSKYSNNPSISMSVRDGQVVLSGKLIKRELTVTADNPNLAIAQFLTQFAANPIEFNNVDVLVLT